MLFTLFVGETSWLVQLLILRLEIVVAQVTSRVREIFVVLPDFSKTNLLIVTIFIYFVKYS